MKLKVLSHRGLNPEEKVEKKLDDSPFYQLVSRSRDFEVFTVVVNMIGLLFAVVNRSSMNLHPHLRVDD